VAKSAKELAESLSVDASAWGSGWGVSAKASFSYSNDYKMNTNDVVLRARHRIDLGKSLIDPSEFVMIKDAIETLATNKELFE